MAYGTNRLLNEEPIHLVNLLAQLVCTSFKKSRVLQHKADDLSFDVLKVFQEMQRNDTSMYKTHAKMSSGVEFNYAISNMYFELTFQVISTV
jgi:hypothetical protein